MFSKNRDRLLEGESREVPDSGTGPAKSELSTDHFSVDGTLIEAWASMKSVKPKDGSVEPPTQGCGRRNTQADF